MTLPASSCMVSVEIWPWSETATYPSVKTAATTTTPMIMTTTPEHDGDAAHRRRLKPAEVFGRQKQSESPERLMEPSLRKLCPFPDWDRRWFRSRLENKIMVIILESGLSNWQGLEPQSACSSSHYTNHTADVHNSCKQNMPLRAKW